ncbi:MAG: FAD-dependent oxidoreductase [Dehalococcoidia bacterium]
MADETDVLIIGAGIIGLSCAVELAEAGRGVTVLDRHLPGAGQSTRTGGGIRLLHGTALLAELSRRSLPTWEGFADRFGVDPQYRRTGHLFLTGRADGEAALRAQAAGQRRAGVAVEVLEAEEIRRQWPYLAATRFTAGSYCGDGGWLDQHAVLHAYADAVTSRGAHLRPGVRVDGLVVEGGRVVGARTSHGTWRAGHVVNAAGPAAGMVAAMADVEIPFVSRWHQLLVVDPVPDVPQDLPWLIDVDRQVHLRPDGDGRALVGGFLGVDEPTDPQRWTRDADPAWVDAVRQAASASFGVLPPDAPVVASWAGLYPGTADSLPVVEVSRPGLVTAAGFAGTGLMHAPAVGQLVVDLIEGRPLDLPEDLSRVRFEGPGVLPERTGF